MLFSGAAAADEQETGDQVRPSLRQVPPGVTITLNDKDGWNKFVDNIREKKEYKCFETEQWEEVGHLIIDYRWFFDYSLKLEHQLELRRKEIVNLESQIGTLKIMLSKEDEGRRFVGSLFEKEHQYRMKLETEKELSSWLHWAGHILSVAAVTAFATMYGLEASDAI